MKKSLRNIVLVEIITPDAKDYAFSLPASYLEAYIAKEKSLSENARITLYRFSNTIPLERMVFLLLKDRPYICGFTCYTWNLETTLHVANLFKQLSSETTIILGGPEIQSAQILEENWFIDILVFGEGETPFLGVVKEYLIGDKKLEDIKGIAFRKESPIVTNPEPNCLKNLDEIPSFFVTKPKETFTGKVILYETARGCAFKCSFCLASLSKGVRYFSMERVKEELKFLLKARPKMLYITDATLNLNEDRFNEILETIAKYNHNTLISGEISLEFLTQESIRLMSSANFWALAGVQSKNQLALENVERHFADSTKESNNLKELVNAHVRTNIELLIGLPGDNYNSFKKTIDSIIILQPEELQCLHLHMIKGIPLREKVEEYQIKYLHTYPTKVWSTFSCSYKEILQCKLLSAFLHILYNRKLARHTLNLIFPAISSSPTEFIEHFIKWCLETGEIKEDGIERMKFFENVRESIDYDRMSTLFGRFISECCLKTNESLNIYREIIFETLQFDRHLFLQEHVIKPINAEIPKEEVIEKLVVRKSPFVEFKYFKYDVNRLSKTPYLRLTDIPKKETSVLFERKHEGSRAFSISKRMAKILDRIDGESTVTEIVDSICRNEQDSNDKCLKSIALLLEKKWIYPVRY